MPLSSLYPSLLLCGALVFAAPASAKAPPARKPQPAKPAAVAQPAMETVGIGYLGRERQSPVIPPYFDPDARDRGVQGARLAIKDNNTTGQFTRQQFVLKDVALAPDADPEPAFKALLTGGARYVVLNLGAEDIERLSALPEAQNALLLDAGSRDDRLRGASCRSNTVHLLPSHAMRADALAQFLAKKRWSKWFLVVGPDAGDQAFASALRRAAARFGAKIVADKPWTHQFDDRRTPEAEIPVLTQGADYDVLVLADEVGRFGDLFAYRTWSARPVVGTQSLMPLAWHYTLEGWGALQLQKRFREQASRWMSEDDYGAWMAVRSIGEAAARTRSTTYESVRNFLLSGDFTLAGFKGVPLSFRPWDGQLRQPVLLASERSLVAVAPIEGFLHPHNELDTLGYDAPESKCRQ